MWYPHALTSTITLFASPIARWHSQPSAPSCTCIIVIFGAAPLTCDSVHLNVLACLVTVTVLPAQAFHLSVELCRNAFALSADGNATTAWLAQWSLLSPGSADTSPLIPV